MRCVLSVCGSEVNVVNAMKAVNAVIGGEVMRIIVPDLHYGGCAYWIGLFLSALSHFKGASILPDKYPDYFISKNKIELRMGSMYRRYWRRSNEIQEPTRQHG